MKKGRLRTAVIGLGKMGLLHAGILNVNPNVELVALCDKSKLMARLYRKIFSRAGMIVVDDLEKLTSLGIDVVYVTTPISSHYYVIRSVYSKGIARNVFTEKTLASDYSQAEELCDLARNLGGVNMVGYMKRFAVTFGKAKESLLQDTIGRVSSFRAYAYSSDFLGSSRHSKTSAPRGGALRDLGCHALDLASWLFGDLQIESVKQSTMMEIGSENAVSFKAVSSEGLEGEFDISQRMQNYRMPEIGLSILGSKGVIEVNDDRLLLKLDDGKSSAWYRHDLNDRVSFWLGETEYFREDECFIKSVLKNQGCEPSFITASKVDFLIDQVRQRSGA
jgi:predicted dehydrogenase